MPDAAPVTRAVWPLKSKVMAVLLHKGCGLAIVSYRQGSVHAQFAAVLIGQMYVLTRLLKRDGRNRNSLTKMQSSD